MTKDDKSLLLALTIGDGYIAPHHYKYKNPGVGTAKLRINHSSKQLEYITWKAGVLGRVFGCNIPVVTSPTTDQTGKKHFYCRIEKSHRYFHILRKYLYRDHRKWIPVKAIERLTPLGMAIWYLDDGSMNVRGTCLDIRLSLGLPKQDCEQIAKALFQKFGFQFKIRRMYGGSKRENYELRMGTDASHKFFDVVKTPILEEIKCLTYKVYDHSAKHPCGVKI